MELAERIPLRLLRFSSDLSELTLRRGCPLKEGVTFDFSVKQNDMEFIYRSLSTQLKDRTSGEVISASEQGVHLSVNILGGEALKSSLQRARGAWRDTSYHGTLQFLVGHTIRVENQDRKSVV